jgi:hypothetical protein
MGRFIKTSLVFLFAITLLSAFWSTNVHAGYEVIPNSLIGTEDVEGLTGKQLALQRYFASMTLLKSSIDDWSGWWTNPTDPLEAGMTSGKRYDLAWSALCLMGMVNKTPAYTELTSALLENYIQRILTRRCWLYAEYYWGPGGVNPPPPPWGDGGGTLDPVAYENVMYSAYVAQLIAQYESVSGDMKYSTEGFDFVYDEDNIFHYTVQSLNQLIYDQMEDDPTGGFPCEPNNIYPFCNQPNSLAFKLSDAIHGTNFFPITEKWRAWMEGYARSAAESSFIIDMYNREYDIASDWGFPGGSTCGALAYMYPWTPNKDFIMEGWEFVNSSPAWAEAATGGMYLGLGIPDLPPEYDIEIGTYFFLFMEKQVHNGMSENSKVPEAFTYYENLMGTLVDTDNDGFEDSYYYNTLHDPANIDWTTLGPMATTAWIAGAMVVKGDSLADQHANPHFMKHAGEPVLAHVPYPKVVVKKAEYFPKKRTLKFTLVNGVAEPSDPATLVCKNINDINYIKCNGKQVRSYTLQNGVLTILANGKIDGEDNYEIKIKNK